MNQPGWITSIVTFCAHIWLWRNFISAWQRMGILLFGALGVMSPWWGTGEFIHLTPNMPGWLRSLLTGTGTLWAFTASCTVLVAAARQQLLRRAPGRRSFLRAATGAAVAVPAALTGYGSFVVRTQFRITEVDFPVHDLPPDLAGLKILQISDLHAGHFLRMSEVGRLIDMANETRPHLAVYTGDLITHPGDPLDETIAQVARLKAEAGILGCHGNHERYSGCEDYATQAAARLGMRFLRHQAVPLGFGQSTLNVAGVDFEKEKPRHMYLPGAENLVVPGVTNLLLAHNPDVFPTAARKGFQAMLAGHTHGGQVTVEILGQGINPALIKTPYVSGLFQKDRCTCYVTTGVGTIGMPVRLGAPPEAALITLRRA